MKKKIYNQPQIEVIRFAVEDVITASGITDTPDELTRNGVNVGNTIFAKIFSK